MKKDIYNKKRYLIISFGLLFIVGSIGYAYTLLKDLPNAQQLSERSVSESTKIYDRTGKILLYEIHGEEKRTVISFDQIPEKVRLATLAAEDVNFYNHGAFDWRGIARAILKNFINLNISQGGSTITQQLIKNSLLGSERTITRKIRELILAILLEQKYSKDEILGLYLNQIPYGSNAYGIASAAQTYFGKSVQDLTLSETATLAALPQAPTYYSPYGSHLNELLQRRNYVLNQMIHAGFITSADAAAAEHESLVFVPPHESIHAPHFVMYVQEYLNKTYGENFVQNGGLKVTTTLDESLQTQAEQIVKDGADKNEKLVKAANAALVSIDPKTGDILAMVGSKSFWDPPIPEKCTPGSTCRFDPQVNITTRLRQPGSSFKPFVYATAFAKGYTPETVLFDVPTEFNPLCDVSAADSIADSNSSKCYHPRNYDGKFRGPVTLRQSLAQSLNIPSVKLLYLAGIEDSLQTAERLGITSLQDRSRFGLSLVLGGGEVSLLEMTSAFGSFAQDGILHPYNAILRVEDAKGNILEEKKDNPTPVLDTEVARTMNNVLSDNNARIPVFSLQSSLYFSDRQVAAKTGTTQDSRDAWVIGYTPSIVVGVWVGNNDNTPMNKNSLSIMVAGPIWHRFLEAALQNTPPESFIPPQPHTAEKPILRGIYRSEPIIKIDKVSGKLATPNTPPELIEELGTGSVQSILASINKDNPLGPPPTDPTTDPQFSHWQYAITHWLAQNSLPSITLPKEFDDIHTTDKHPVISIPGLDPQNIFIGPLTQITVHVQSSFALQEVSLFVNDELINSQINPINTGDFSFTLPETLHTGNYHILVRVFDTVGNTTELEKIISVKE